MLDYDDPFRLRHAREQPRPYNMLIVRIHIHVFYILRIRPNSGGNEEYKTHVRMWIRTKSMLDGLGCSLARRGRKESSENNVRMQALGVPKATLGVPMANCPGSTQGAPCQFPVLPWVLPELPWELPVLPWEFPGLAKPVFWQSCPPPPTPNQPHTPPHPHPTALPQTPYVRTPSLSRDLTLQKVSSKLL